MSVPFRTTKSMTAVRTVLQGAGRAVSAQEIHHLLYQQGQPVGLASIYRALEHLVAAGGAERIRRGQEDAYVLCPATHHHHAICRTCGRVDQIDVCPSPPAETGQGFTIDTHQTVYYGRCPDCR